MRNIKFLENLLENGNLEFNKTIKKWECSRSGCGMCFLRSNCFDLFGATVPRFEDEYVLPYKELNPEWFL